MTRGEAIQDRPNIETGTQILGAVFTGRAGVYVDFTESPTPYTLAIKQVDMVASSNGDESLENTLNGIVAVTNRFIPFNLSEYERVLKEQALMQGVSRLTPQHSVGLSNFIGRAGICQEHALFSSAILSIIQERKVATQLSQTLNGTIRVRSTSPYSTDTNRHLATYYQHHPTGKEYILELGQLAAIEVLQ